MNDPEVWRRRFEQYRPLELVRFIQNTSRKDDVANVLATEELERQLRALGMTERRGT